MTGVTRLSSYRELMVDLSVCECMCVRWPSERQVWGKMWHSMGGNKRPRQPTHLQRWRNSELVWAQCQLYGDLWSAKRSCSNTRWFITKKIYTQRVKKKRSIKVTLLWEQPSHKERKCVEWCPHKCHMASEAKFQGEYVFIFTSCHICTTKCKAKSHFTYV